MNFSLEKCFPGKINHFQRTIFNKARKNLLARKIDLSVETLETTHLRFDFTAWNSSALCVTVKDSKSRRFKRVEAWNCYKKTEQQFLFREDFRGRGFAGFSRGFEDGVSRVLQGFSKTRVRGFFKGFQGHGFEGSSKVWGLQGDT